MYKKIQKLNIIKKELDKEKEKALFYGLNINSEDYKKGGVIDVIEFMSHKVIDRKSYLKEYNGKITKMGKLKKEIDAEKRSLEFEREEEKKYYIKKKAESNKEGKEERDEYNEGTSKGCEIDRKRKEVMKMYNKKINLFNPRKESNNV